MRRFIPLVPVMIIATSLWMRDAQAQFGPPGGGGGLGPGGPSFFRSTSTGTGPRRGGSREIGTGTGAHAATGMAWDA